jgi:hypothetical protein
VVLFASVSVAQAPQKVGYQGLLLKSDGTPETGMVMMTFSVFATPTGGAALWTEDQTLALSQGYYATYLGDVTPLPPMLFDGTERYLEIAVGGVPLSPRMRLSSVPYAISAATARDLTGGTVNASQIQVGGATVIDSSGSLTGAAAYAAGAGITIANKTIAVRACSAGEVLRYSGAPNNSWDCATIAPASSDAGVVSYTADSNGGLQLMPPDFTSFSLLRSCNSGQVLKWNGTAWTCQTDATGSGTVTQVTGAAPISIANGSTTPAVSLAPCAADQIYQMNSGGTAWSCQTPSAGAGTVTNVSGTAPINVANGGTTPTVSIPQATGSTNGYLSSTDWNTFNGKGSVTNVTGTAPINVATGSTTPSISIAAAGASTNGYLSSTDWNTFNAKGTVTNVTGTAPISVATGTTTPSISMAAATTSANGYLSSTDWNTFNGKAPASGSANYIQNSVAGQAASFNITGTAQATKVGCGMAASYPLDVANFSNQQTVARFGSPPVTLGGSGPYVGFNATWNGGTAFAATTGFAANIMFDPPSGQFWISKTAGSVSGGTSVALVTPFVIDGAGHPGFNAGCCPFALSQALTVGSNGSNGNGAYLANTGTWTNVSTREKKTQIRVANDALGLLDHVKVYRYRYRMPNGGDDGRDHLGVIAEELPDVVASDDHRGAPTGELIGLALGADRELAAKVKALESENAKQAKLIEQLTRRLEAVEAGRRSH